MAVDVVYFDKKCFGLNKSEMKLLSIITVLADNNLAYRGTIVEIARLMGYKAKKIDAKTRDIIRQAISSLEAQNLIKTILDIDTYTLTLSRTAENERYIKVNKRWIKDVIELLNKEKFGIDWGNIIQVLLYITDNTDTFNEEQLISYDEIHIFLKEEYNNNLSKEKIGRAIKVITNNKLNMCWAKYRYSVKEINGKRDIKRIGTHYNFNAW